MGVWQGPESQCAALDKLLRQSLSLFGYLLHIITHWKEHNHSTLKMHHRPHCRGAGRQRKVQRIRHDKNIFANITSCSHTNEESPPSTKPLFNSSTLSPSRKLPNESEKAMRFEFETYLHREGEWGGIYHRVI